MLLTHSPASHLNDLLPPVAICPPSGKPKMNAEWLNYHHLFYFWNVAREGSVARACEKLHLAQPTISSQIRTLENSLGEKLFVRSGRSLVLTDVGHVVYGYASEIFSLGSELMDTLKGRPTGRPVRLIVGVADVFPKLIAYRVLEPVFKLPESVQVICHEGKVERLLAELSIQGLDLVLSDAPLNPSVRVKAYSHLLGTRNVSVFGTKQLASTYGTGFPHSLNGAPFLLPTDNTMLRRSLDQWFDTHEITPRVVGEFEDNALLKVFGQSGVGLFAASSTIEREVQEQYNVLLVGQLGISESFYAISIDRRIKHPAVAAIVEAARSQLFIERVPVHP